MTFRVYLLFMGVATLICWGAVGMVTYAIDPFANGASGIFLFYATLFAALVGTLALFGIIVRRLFFRDELHAARVWIAFRQSIWFALLILIILALSHAELLRWWLILLLIAFFTVIEYLLLSLFERHPPSPSQGS